MEYLTVMKNLNLETKKWIWNTWDQYKPEWFITLLWNDYPTSPITAASHTRHLLNIFLKDVCGCKRCGEIPEFPYRMGVTSFQERTEDHDGKVVFHTHLHLFNTNSYFDRPNRQGDEYLKWFLTHKVGRKVYRLLKTSSIGNEGVVVRKWNEDHHRYYNLKEMERQKKKALTRYTQDGDLLLDIENSDLLPMTAQTHGHQALPKRTNRSLRSTVGIQSTMG